MRLGLIRACMCAHGEKSAKSEGNEYFFRLQVDEMNKNMLSKMGVKLATGVYMGKDFLDIGIIV